MNNNIIEATQQSLGYPPLKKIDPNIQEPKTSDTPSQQENLGQAAIPAVLAGLFKFTRTEKGCNYILTGGNGRSWMDTIFEDKKGDVVEKVAHFAGISPDVAGEKMEDIAREAVVTLHHDTTDAKASAEKMKAYMGDQRHYILTYLPAELQVGYLLEDNSIDDRTNKMEGPVSNLMHKIENKFSGGS